MKHNAASNACWAAMARSRKRGGQHIAILRLEMGWETIRANTVHSTRDGRTWRVQEGLRDKVETVYYNGLVIFDKCPSVH